MKTKQITVYSKDIKYLSEILEALTRQGWTVDKAIHSKWRWSKLDYYHCFKASPKLKQRTDLELNLYFEQ